MKCLHYAMSHDAKSLISHRISLLFYKHFYISVRQLKFIFSVGHLVFWNWAFTLCFYAVKPSKVCVPICLVPKNQTETDFWVSFKLMVWLCLHESRSGYTGNLRYQQYYLYLKWRDWEPWRQYQHCSSCSVISVVQVTRYKLLGIKSVAVLSLRWPQGPWRAAELHIGWYLGSAGKF